MSPAVSCLVDFTAPNRRKKRVRFQDELTAYDTLTSPSDLQTNDALDVSPRPAALPEGSAETGDGSLTSYPAQTSAWITRTPLTATWHLPSLPAAGQGDGVNGEDPAAQTSGWWDRKVSSMYVSAPLTVLPSVQCQDAVDIMLEEGLDQLPVVSQPGELVGIVTLRSLMTSLAVQRSLPSTPVGEVMCRDLCTLSRDHTLLELSKKLQLHGCALIVHSQRRVTEQGKVANKMVVIGLVTPTDLLGYIVRTSLSV
ncbi:cystathionine beta-synthase-like [Amphibalanus amphitrite]|uniref:cystathionine beta-synthase-like n=1 Tax=Amphibalanus amphitrite TaxID=1232801 RepID=UPI001C91CBF1|nr:cystathionine beta-synthase-like [Amphibalanus amphitrite]